MMKKLWIYIWLTGILANSLGAQPEIKTALNTFTVAEFNTLLRDFDLNASTQNGYSITETEYARLQEAWNSLPMTDRIHLMNSKNGWQDFAKMLLVDLLMATPWENHVKKAARYGAIAISITVGRYKNSITLKEARKTLVDLLQEGPRMFVHGRLVITDRIKTQAKERAGGKALKRLNKWEALINNHQNDSDFKKLQVVNDFFQRYIEETADWGEAKGNDYWQSPIETLVRGKGDCDDFAMAKYVSLRLLGIPAEQLRIGLVEHPDLGGHGVLLFYPANDNNPWVLDNLRSDLLGASMGSILRLSVRTRFDKMKPLWGLNENALTRYDENLNEILTHKNPYDEFPAFRTALANSRKLLPLDDVKPPAYAGTIHKTRGGMDDNRSKEKP